MFNKVRVSTVQVSYLSIFSYFALESVGAWPSYVCIRYIFSDAYSHIRVLNTEQATRRYCRSYLVYPPFLRVVLSATFLLLYNIYNLYIHRYMIGDCKEKNILFDHRAHWVAVATLWRTFHHDGKISPAWWGWGEHSLPLSLYLLSRVVGTLLPRGQIHSSIFLLYPYMHSVGRLTGVCILSPNLYTFMEPRNWFR